MYGNPQIPHTKMSQIPEAETPKLEIPSPTTPQKTLESQNSKSQVQPHPQKQSETPKLEIPSSTPPNQRTRLARVHAGERRVARDLGCPHAMALQSKECNLIL